MPHDEDCHKSDSAPVGAGCHKACKSPVSGPFAEDIVRAGGAKCGQDWARMGMTSAQARRMMAIFCEALTEAYEETRDQMPRRPDRGL